MFPIKNSVPVRFPPLVTYALVGANLLVFLFQTSLPPQGSVEFAYLYGLVPARYTQPEWALRTGLDPSSYLPFLTTMFLHGGWLHLILNMWTLWLFGGAVEDRLGYLRFAIFYLLCGLAASLAHTFANADSTVPVVGASGAIAGVLGAYVRLFPFARIVMLVPIIFIPLFFTLPAIIYIGFWLLLQVFQGALSVWIPQSEGGVAWWAHIGGFAAGVILIPLICQSRSCYRPYYGDEGALGFRPEKR